MATERILPAAALPSAGAGTITTPFQFLVSGEDNLRVRVWSRATAGTLIIGVRAVALDGSIQVTNEPIGLVNVSDPQTRMMKLSAGYVLSVAAEIVDAFVVRGQCFVQIDLVRGFDSALVTLATLLQGYVGTRIGLAYPGSPLQDPLEGPGWVRTLFGALAPGPGAAVTGAFPLNAEARLLELHLSLVTDATAVARFPRLVAQDSGGNQRWIALAARNQLAAETIAYSFAPGVPSSTIPNNGFMTVGLPYPHRVSGGDVYTTSGTGLQAGDAWSAVTLTVEQWINPWL